MTTNQALVTSAYLIFNDLAEKVVRSVMLDVPPAGQGQKSGYVWDRVFSYMAATEVIRLMKVAPNAPSAVKHQRISAPNKVTILELLSLGQRDHRRRFTFDMDEQDVQARAEVGAWVLMTPALNILRPKVDSWVKDYRGLSVEWMDGEAHHFPLFNDVDSGLLSQRVSDYTSDASIVEAVRQGVYDLSVIERVIEEGLDAEMVSAVLGGR